MNVHAEWFGARSVGFEFFAPFAYRDDFDRVNDEPALVMHGASSDVVLSGTLEDLHDRLQQGVDELEEPAQRAMARYHEDQEFHATLMDVYQRLASVEGRHDDSDTALEMLHSLITRLWDAEGHPIDDAQPREIIVSA